MCTESSIEMDSKPAPSSPSVIKLKAQFSRIASIRNFSVTSEIAVNPLTVLRAHQVVILVCSIMLMTVALQIPTILYFISTAPSTITSSFIGEIDFKTCSVDINRTSSVITTSESSLGDYCPQVPPLVSQNELFYNACLSNSLMLVQAIEAVNSFLGNTAQCSNSAIPFLCDAMFLLCGDDNSAVNLIEECVKIRDNDCSAEWRLLENVFNLPLPSCESFTMNRTITFSKAPPLECPSQFDAFCDSVCLPVCEEYSLVPRDASVASNTLTIIFIIIGMIWGLITLIACYYNRKKMFKIPQIYVVYNTVNLLIVFLVYVVPLIFGEKLLCSDSNLIVAFYNPSKYCQAQGFIIQTGIFYFIGFLLLHLAHLFFAIAFPIKAKLFMIDYSKRAHAIEMIIIMVLGLVPGTIIVSTSGYQIDGFLPDLCSPNNREALFYSLVLPIEISATIGLSLLFTTFWILRQNHQVNTVRSNHEQSSHKPNTIISILKVLCTGFSTPEKKLFILFWYYTIALIVLLAYLALQLLTGDSTIEQVQNYVSCSIGGYAPECDIYKEKIENITWPNYYLDLAHTLLLCSIFLSNLTYVLQIKDIKKLFEKLFFKSKTSVSENSKSDTVV